MCALCECDWLYSWQLVYLGLAENMWLTGLLLSFKASLEEGHENKPASLRLKDRFCLFPAVSVQYL